MNAPFFNRAEELNFLHKKFRSKQPELLIFRGRRRVGKTFLLKEFSRQINGLYLLATVTSAQDQLQSFSQAVSDYFGDPLPAMRPFAAWEELFLYLQQRLQKRTAVIIDEYPYLLEAQPGLSTILQKYWDEYYRANNNMLLVLNGSALSMMEKETLASKAPLYGRRTGQWFVSPFDPIENNEFFANTSLIRGIEWYAISGGMPYYSQIFSRHATPLEAIFHEVLTYGEALFDEVEFVLRGEFRNPRSYFPILKTIAAGSQKFGEISSKTGYDRANLTKYLSVLEALHLIRRDVPITENNPEKSKKGLYFISDYFMNLWFHYAFPHRSKLETGGREQIMEKIIRPSFDKFISRVCERIIRQLLLKDFFKLNLQFDRVGRHWDSQTEIDIFAYTKDGDTVIGEIKWTNSPVGEEVLHTLDKKISRVNSLIQGTTMKIIISKSGFVKGLTRKHADVILIDLRKYKL
jgi:hypothetical protein